MVRVEGQYVANRASRKISKVGIQVPSEREKKPKSLVCSQSPAEVVSCCKLHSLADVPLVLVVEKPMDLMGQSLSQLHFTFQMETRSCFLGVSPWNH